jgi:type III secretion system chaperone SycN
MNNIASIDVVNQFIRQLGITSLDWDGAPLTLTFDRLGILSIELSNWGLTLALANEIEEFQIGPLAIKAFRAVHTDQQLPFSVHTGLHGDRELMFITSLTPQELDLANINQALTQLDYLHNQLRN